VLEVAGRPLAAWSVEALARTRASTRWSSSCTGIDLERGAAGGRSARRRSPRAAGRTTFVEGGAGDRTRRWRACARRTPTPSSCSSHDRCEAHARAGARGEGARARDARSAPAPARRHGKGHDQARRRGQHRARDSAARGCWLAQTPPGRAPRRADRRPRGRGPRGRRGHGRGRRARAAGGRPVALVEGSTRT